MRLWDWLRGHRRIVNAACIALLLTAFTAYALAFQKQIVVRVESDQIQVSAPNGEAFSIAFDEMRSIQLTKDMDYGAPMAGGESDNFLTGIWESASFGKCSLCASSRIHSCIVVKTAAATYAFNFESDASTEALYRAILARTTLDPG